MANIFEGTEPPRWLESIAKPVDADALGHLVGQGLAGIVNSFQTETPQDEALGLGKTGDSKGLSQGMLEARLNEADPLWKQKFQLSVENSRLGQVSKWMQVQAAGSRMAVLDEQLKAKQQTTQDEADDQALFNQSVSAVGNDTTKLLNTPMPAFKSNKYRSMWATSILAASRSSAATASKLDEANFLKRLSALPDPIARLEIQQMKDPAQRLQALGFAEAAAAQNAQNTAAQASLDAEGRGQQPSVTISGNKVTTAYKPAIATASQPKLGTQTLPNGQVVNWMQTGPQTFHFITDEQARSADNLQRKLSDLQGQISTLSGTNLLTKVQRNTLNSLTTKRAGLISELNSLTNHVLTTGKPAAPAPAPAPDTSGGDQTTSGLKYSILPQ